MEKINHSQRAHALLSASGASRWLNCTPSARLEEQFSEKAQTKYAEEGTLAHELGELYLRRDALQSISDTDFEQKLEEIMSNELFNDEMLDMVPVYVDYCLAQYAEASTNSSLAILEIEQKLDLTEFVPESFGTADCNIIADEVLEVIDLKYGKGVPVYATWNKQLMLYGLGSLRKYDTMYDIKKIRLTIVQPRIDNISSWEISVSELLEWAITELKPKAAMAFEGKGELCTGEWCRFCGVKNRCRKLYEQTVEVAKHEFAAPAVLSDQEITDMLVKAPAVIAWLGGLLEYAQTKAINENKKWPGFKLVEGRSTRKWINEDDVVNALYARMPHLTEDDLFESKLKPITSIEKLIGKKVFAEQFSDIVIKSAGKLTLVPESDKRQAVGLASAQQDFSD